MLAPFGLEKAIRSLNEELKERYPDIQIMSKLEPDGQTIPENFRTSLYFIYQEGLNNISKHANTTEVKIHFHFDDQHAELELQDNGAGFLLPQSWVQLARQGHLGLVGMRERVERIDGAIDIRSAPGAGTKILVSVSLRAISIPSSRRSGTPAASLPTRTKRKSANGRTPSKRR